MKVATVVSYTVALPTYVYSYVNAMWNQLLFLVKLSVLVNHII